MQSQQSLLFVRVVEFANIRVEKATINALHRSGSGKRQAVCGERQSPQFQSRAAGMAHFCSSNPVIPLHPTAPLRCSIPVFQLDSHDISSHRIASPSRRDKPLKGLETSTQRKPAPVKFVCLLVRGPEAWISYAPRSLTSCPVATAQTDRSVHAF